MYIEDIGVTETVTDSTVICQLILQVAGALTLTLIRCHKLLVIHGVVCRYVVEITTIFAEVASTGDRESLILS